MKLVWPVIALIAATALAGCTNPPPADGEGSVTAVTVTRAPDSVAPNSRATVCWSVTGSGTIPHTALHTDTTSHPGQAGFDAYGGPAYYPNNATAATPVTLPGQFCTDIPVGTQTVYFRAHAMTSAPGVVSEEKRITVTGGANVGALAATLRSGYNTTAAPNSRVTVCWDVTGQGTIPHTAIHTDNVSRPTAVSFDAYRGQAFYPNNTTAATPPYTLPGTFCTGLQMPSNGTLYFRAHAMTSPPGAMSTTEGSIRVNDTAAQQGAVVSTGWSPTPPTTAPRGQNVTLCWNVRGVSTGTIPHTALHTDDQSHATDPTATFEDYDGRTYYPDNMTAANQSGYAISATGTVYCTNVMMPNTLGAFLYVRPHAMDAVAGAPGRLGPEALITAS